MKNSHIVAGRRHSRLATRTGIDYCEAQSGFTLVELLVGLVISIFIGAVAMTYLVTSARMLTNQNSEDLIQENARFAFEIMASSVRLGYSNNSLHAQAKTKGVPPEKVCDGDVECNTDGLNYTIAGTSYNSDRIATDYIGDDITTCTGEVINSERKIITVFYVADNDGDGISSLYCEAYVATFDTVELDYTTEGFASLPAVPLIDGVDSLQVQYGVDVDTDESVDKYLTYTSVMALPGGIPEIRAIRLGLLLSSGQSIVSEQNTLSRESRDYQLFESSFSRNDGVLRRIFTTTVFLPNLRDVSS